MTVIKICGITNEYDRDMCLQEGAQLLGINIYSKSKRYVAPDMLKRLMVSDIRKSIVLVGVNNSFDEWAEIIEKYEPGYIQLHGNEGLNIVEKLKVSFDKVAIIKKVTIEETLNYSKILEIADYILCDSVSDGYGGSGKRFDWERLGGLDTSIRERLFIAGGITPDNIQEVIGYGSYGIDIASGSENYPGKKDINKVRLLISKVRN